MGLSPDQVMAMPLHDYQAAIYHMNKSRDPDGDDVDPLSAEEFEEMFADLEARGMGRPN